MSRTDRAIWIRATPLLALLATIALSLHLQAEDPDTITSLPTHQLSLPPTDNVLVLTRIDQKSIDTTDSSPADLRWIGITRQIPQHLIDRHLSDPNTGWSDTTIGPIWRLTLTSVGAKGIRLFLRHLNLDGAHLWIHRGDYTSLSTYTQRGPYSDGEVWSPIILGETVTIEYQPDHNEALNGSRVLPFDIPAIGHLWNTPREINAKDTGRTPNKTSDHCFQDLTCRANSDEELARFAGAIAMISIVDEETKRHGYCSGALVNDRVSTSLIPYFLTAAHCVATESEARSIEFHWFLQNRNCSGESSRDYDDRYSTTSGSTLLEVETGSLRNEGISPWGRGDAALLKLLSEPPPEVYYLGWNARSTAISIGTNVLGIHHAEAKAKQVSFGEISFRYPNMLSVRWGNGLILGGASGSPVINQDGQILGIASGGQDDHEGCFDQGSPTLYSSLASFYPKIEDYLNSTVAPPPPSSPSQDSGPHSLTVGVPQGFQLNPASTGILQSSDRAYYVDVPSGTSDLLITVSSDIPTIDVDLYVRYQEPPVPGRYDWRSVGPSGNEAIVINATSTPSLRPGRYYIALLLYDVPSQAATGLVTATTTNRVVSDEGTVESMQFVRIPSGTFAMGSIGQDASGIEQPVTTVRLTKSIEIGKFEVTQHEWVSVMNSNPSSNVACGPRCPVESVSRVQANEFLDRLNHSDDSYRYRLPTEAEWEYAARAGTIGDTYGPLESIGWYSGNSGDRLQAVGRKDSNPFGLHDMIGNVYEWVADWSGSYLGGSVTDPTGPSSGTVGVIRGGSYHHNAVVSRASHRYFLDPSNRHSDVGFRIVRTLKSSMLGGVLQSGQPVEFRISSSEIRTLQNGTRSFIIDVPAGSQSLSIVLESDQSGVDVDLYVRHQHDTQVSQYDWKSASSSGSESIEISTDTVPALRPGRYYISLVLYRSSVLHASGTLTARVTARTTGPLGIQFVQISPGEFNMGSSSVEAYDNEEPITRVMISRAFEIGAHEVTHGQWQELMGTSPASSEACELDCPVVGVSWNDIQKFLEKLNSDEMDHEYRLPTEAEWEYAARGGIASDRYGPLDSIAWHIGNSNDRLQRVGTKAPNQYGLYDMIGNVHEWVADWYGAYTGGRITDPTGPAFGFSRVVRGGSKHDGGSENRASYRGWDRADARYANVGFRIVRSVRREVDTPLGGELVLGVPRQYRIPQDLRQIFLNGEKSYFVDIPDGAVQLSVSVIAQDPSIDVDLFVSYQVDNTSERYGWASRSLSGDESITIGADQQLRAGRYYISLLLYGNSSVPVEGSITATTR